MGRILLYTTDGCRHCGRVYAALVSAIERINELREDSEDNLSVQECVVLVNVARLPNRREELLQVTSKKSVPQVLFNKEHVGGAAEIYEWEEDGSLEERLSTVLAGETPAFPVPPRSDEALEDRVLDLSRMEKRVLLLDDLHTRLRDPAESDFHKRIRDRRKGFRSIKRVFVGKDLVDAIVELTGETTDRARDLAAQLQRYRYISCVSRKAVVTFRQLQSDKTLYRYYCDSNPWVLNNRRRFDRKPRDAVVVAQELQEQCVHMGDRYLSLGGKGVDYERLKASEEFRAYQQTAVELQAVDLSGLDETARKALFINLYNAMVIHANVSIGPPKTVLQRMNFFKKVCYIVGGNKFTLNDIEHGVLRGNKKPVGIATKVPFRSGDPRLQFVIPLDPRVHFVLVCGAKGCPPIKIVNAQNLDQALDWATEGFCDGEVVVSGNTIKLSMLFKWYAGDFGQTTQEVLQWIAKHTPDSHLLHAALASHKPSALKVKYNTYDWSLNNDTPEVREDLYELEDSESESATSDFSATLSRTSLITINSKEEVFRERTVTTDDDTVTFSESDTDDDGNGRQKSLNRRSQSFQIKPTEARRSLPKNSSAAAVTGKLECDDFSCSIVFDEEDRPATKR